MGIVLDQSGIVFGGDRLHGRQGAAHPGIVDRDDGPGFAEDVVDKLFSPFFSTKTTGSGLGLTICAQIIKSHGGVTAAANHPEGGAVFSFILPLPRNAPSV